MRERKAPTAKPQVAGMPGRGVAVPAKEVPDCSIAVVPTQPGIRENQLPGPWLSPG